MCVADLFKEYILTIDQPFIIAKYDGEIEDIIYCSWINKKIDDNIKDKEISYISIREIRNIRCLYFEFYMED